jgi:hypothetical protein
MIHRRSKPSPEWLAGATTITPPSLFPEKCSFHLDDGVGTRDFSICESFSHFSRWFWVRLRMLSRLSRHCFSFCSKRSKDFDDNFLKEIPELRYDLAKSATTIPGVVFWDRRLQRWVHWNYH